MWLKVLVFSACSTTIMDFTSASPHDVIRAECMQKYSNLKEEDVFGIFQVKGEIKDETNMDAKCAFSCGTVKKGMADDAGNIDIAKMKEFISQIYSSKMQPDAVNSLIDKCAAERSESSPCEKIYQFHKCHMKVFLSL